MQFILASASPRRAHILDKCHIQYRVHASHAEEIEDEMADPVTLVLENARIKALAVAHKFPDDVIVAADTIVWDGHKILGKPNDFEHACAMFDSYGVEPITVYSGLAVVVNGSCVSGFDRTDINVRLSGKERLRPLLKDLFSLDKSGGFTIEGLGAMMFDRITGSYDNVLGLPMHLVADLLDEVNIQLMDFVSHEAS